MAGEVISLSDIRKKELYEIFQDFARNGKRVLGFAYREFSQGTTIDEHTEIESQLIFVGFIAMMDPPRDEVAPAIATCHQAGIRVIMITGDSELTAQAVGKMIGLSGDSVDATTLSQLSDDELLEKLQTTNIFSRIAPEDKLRIIRILKSQ